LVNSNPQKIEETSVIETDLLIIGGGVGGSCAALKTDDNLKVVMLDKGSIRRGGATGPGGPDHLSTIPNEGVTALDVVTSLREDGVPKEAPNIEPRSGLMDENLNYVMIDKAKWAIDELEKAGCNLKWDDGEYNWIPWYITPGKKTGIRIHGFNFKPTLTAAVRRKKNVKVIERTMAIDLLTNGNRVVGATAFNIRTGQFTVFKAKMTMVATGPVERIYEPEGGAAPKYRMVYTLFPGSGDGHAMVYRAGGEMVNMEFPYTTLHGADFLTMHYGHFTHAGKKTGMVYDSQGNYLCNMPLKYKKCLELEEKGLTPVYYGLEHLDEDQHNMREIGNADMIPIFSKYLEERGFDPTTHRFEVMSPKASGLSGSYPGLAGVAVDEDGKTSLEGLYAAGDMIGEVHFRGTLEAAIIGFGLGIKASDIIRNASNPVIDDKQVQKHKELCFRHLQSDSGVDPLEFESKIRSICDKYCGRLMTDGKLSEGLRRLMDVKNDWLPEIQANSPHELMKTQECRNLMDVAEMHIRCAIERKETRHYFFRRDYPDKDKKFEGKAIVLKQVNGNNELSLRAMPGLKPEYAKEGGK
jgi:adenylylsulfate reductase subunit A